MGKKEKSTGMKGMKGIKNNIFSPIGTRTPHVLPHPRHGLEILPVGGGQSSNVVPAEDQLNSQR
jgi:hypothetical protein